MMDLNAVACAITNADQELLRTKAVYTVAHSLVKLPRPQRPVETELTAAAVVQDAFSRVLSDMQLSQVPLSET